MEENKETVENINVEETGNVDTQTTNQIEVQAEKTFTQEDVELYFPNVLFYGIIKLGKINANLWLYFPNVLFYGIIRY